MAYAQYVAMYAVYEPRHSGVLAIFPFEPTNISVWLAFELLQAGPQSVCANDVAPLNILAMLVTLDTSHFEMSPLNDVAPLNM